MLAEDVLRVHLSEVYMTLRYSIATASESRIVLYFLFAISAVSWNEIDFYLSKTQYHMTDYSHLHEIDAVYIPSSLQRMNPDISIAMREAI